MNRKIEFRGQSIKGDWNYGLLCHDKTKDRDYEWFISNKVGKPYAFGVIPETIGQLWATINDKDFFEGDIIHFEKDNIIYLIIYNDVNKCFSFVDNDEYDKIQHADELTRLNILINKGIINVGLIERKKPKIIGNIHDNPELLKIDKVL